jgi:hypothetical protein
MIESMKAAGALSLRQIAARSMSTKLVTRRNVTPGVLNACGPMR